MAHEYGTMLIEQDEQVDALEEKNSEMDERERDERKAV
jgi:hypothetical protein